MSEKEYLKAWRERNKERVKEYGKRAYYKNHKRTLEIKKKWREQNIELLRKKQRERKKEQYHKLRKLIIEHYGGKCNCCGENHYEFLVIDHVNGSGTKERKKIGAANNFYRKIIKENYPKDYQILCANCNMARRNNGVCPHEK